MSSLRMIRLVLMCMAVVQPAGTVFAQSVCLPAPRLLTTKPMGGTVGTQVDISITGENIEDADGLYFSDPKISATPKLNV